MAYSYLDGSATGGILSQTPPGTQSATPYVPGNGTAPYSAPQVPGTGSAAMGSGGTFNVANYSGLTDYEKNKLASLASGHDFFMADSFMNGIKSKYNDPLTVIGQGEAWLTPDELRAKTNALQSNLWSGGGSGGGGGGAGGGSSAGGGAATGGLGGLLNNGVTGAPTSASPGSLGSFPNINTGNIGAGQSGGNGGQIGTQTNGQTNGLIPSNQTGSNQGLPMMQMGAQNGLQQYYNTPGYQLTNGQGAVNNFQTSPGYQFAVNEALKQVQQQGASRGLLDSGAGLRAMTDRAQGMANQEFNNWQNNQQNQYNQYQNRLQGLASGSTGSDMAYNLGQGIGQNNMQTGSNLGSIYANQGNTLFGGLVGAGGAQAQNVTQAGNMQAQILGSNLQTQMMLAALAAGQQKQ